jgi:sulfoxide reductase heme-binding subunit YedZ
LPSLKLAKLVVFVLALLPALLFANDLVSDALARPWRTLIDDSGLWSMRFLVLGLCLTPLTAWIGLTVLREFRRMIGLFAAFYAALHLFAWARQYGYDWPYLADEIVLRIYLGIGFVGALLLVPLAVTSPAVMHRLLGAQRWRRLHWLMYPVVVAALIHFWLAHGLRMPEVTIEVALVAACFAWRVWPARAPA